jgi:hypothetical protein
MFKADRVFCQSNPQTGRIEWFFSAREGIYGPFVDKARAAHELDAFIKSCIKNADDGGRKAGKNTDKLSLVPMHDFALKRGK